MPVTAIITLPNENTMTFNLNSQYLHFILNGDMYHGDLTTISGGNR